MKPSKLSPVFVIQRFRAETLHKIAGIEYYDLMGDTGKEWNGDPKKAYFFESIVQAARVAASEGAEIRVLVSDKDAKEFGL